MALLWTDSEKLAALTVRVVPGSQPGSLHSPC